MASIYTNIRKSSIAMFISEIMFKSMKDTHPTDGSFDFIFHSIEWLEQTNTGLSTFHLQFLIKLTKYIGFGLEHYVSDSSVELIRQLGKENYGRHINLTRAEQNDSLERMIMFYQEHVEGFGAVKSLPILREVFSN